MSKEKQIEEMARIIADVNATLRCSAEVCRLCEFFKVDGELCKDCISAKALYNAGYRKQSEGELTRAHIQAHYEAIYALADMVLQFGYSTTFRKQDAVCDGGLSALEYAFGALLDCGCKTNSNGTITLKNLWAFQEEMRVKMEGGE